MMKEFLDSIRFSLKKLTTLLEGETKERLDKNLEGDLSCYYKLPMFLYETGKEELAKKVVDSINDTFLTEEGDFKTKKDLKSEKSEYVEYWSYFNGWILRASYLLNHLSHPRALDFFQSFYLGDGKFSSYCFKKDEKRITDLLTVSHHGLFYLESELKPAWSKEAAKFLMKAFDVQLESNHQFLLRFNEEGSVISEYAKEQQMFFSVKRNQGKNQLYFMLAYPAAFLALYYRKTGDKKALEYAQHYVDYIINCDEEVYYSRFSHKVSWAASILYAETKNPKYLMIVEKIVNFFLSIQSKDGIWFAEEGPSVYLDQSAEIGCWLSQILKNIALPVLKKENQSQLFKRFDPIIEKDDRSSAYSADIILA